MFVCGCAYAVSRTDKNHLDYRDKLAKGDEFFVRYIHIFLNSLNNAL